MQGRGGAHLLALVEAGHGAVAQRQHASLDRVGGGGDLAVEGDHQAAVGLHATHHAALKWLARLELHVRRVEAGHERRDQLALGPLEEVALPRLEVVDVLRLARRQQVLRQLLACLQRLDLGLGFLLLRRHMFGGHLGLRPQRVLLLGRESHRGARLVSLREDLERVARRVCVTAGAQPREQKICRVQSAMCSASGCGTIGCHVVVVVLAPGDARQVQVRDRRNTREMQVRCWRGAGGGGAGGAHLRSCSSRRYLRSRKATAG